MPFKSKAQFRYLWKFRPDIANKWTKEGHKIPNKEYADDKEIGENIDVNIMFGAR